MHAVINEATLATSTGEAIMFWVMAVLMITGALGVLFFKKAAYAALSMVLVMLALAVLYLTQGAPFMGIVQVVVYTGAIMMLFLFVLMMIGLQASDEYQTQRRSHIVAAVAGGSALAIVLGAMVWVVGWSGNTGYTADAYTDEPVEKLAHSLFADHWLSMELAAALLITAAVGAVLLTHADRLSPRRTQKHVVEAKMRAYAASGRHVGQHTAPGVYARSTSPDVPALSGQTGKPVTESVPRVLRVRGLDRSIASIDPQLASRLHSETETTAHPTTVNQSGSWGMGGLSAPDGLIQYEAGRSVQPSVEATAAQPEPKEQSK